MEIQNCSKRLIKHGILNIKLLQNNQMISCYMLQCGIATSYSVILPNRNVLRQTVFESWNSIGADQI